jgi:glycosyltransferase involved in cell wall biosynthesis
MKTISVLIPTLGRDDVLIDTLKALLTQTRLPDEIVISDQNNPWLPQVEKYIQEIKARPAPRIVHLHNAQPGLVANYNAALSAATSRIVLF